MDNCYLCSAPTGEEFYCDGCESYVCNFCRTLNEEDLPFYHTAEDHQIDTLEE